MAQSSQLLAAKCRSRRRGPSCNLLKFYCIHQNVCLYCVYVLAAQLTCMQKMVWFESCTLSFARCRELGICLMPSGQGRYLIPPKMSLPPLQDSFEDLLLTELRSKIKRQDRGFTRAITNIQNMRHCGAIAAGT